MKPLPAHILSKAVSSATDEVDPALSGAGPEPEHPLAAALRGALAQPATTSLGAFAGIVERLVGELNLASAADKATSQAIKSTAN